GNGGPLSGGERGSSVVVFVECDAVHAEGEAQQVDVLLQHVTDPQAAVDEMVRVTRPGGRVVLIDTDWRTFGSTTDPEFEQRLRAIGSPLATPHAGGFLRAYALAAGLVDVDVLPVVHHANHRAPDGSDGLPPHDVVTEFRAAQGLDRTGLDAYFAEMQRQSDNGTLSVVLTMWGATGTVPA
ncbi:MAG: methyltransferase domain-containing protein, partial [Microthrixaceae bacterium]